MTPERALIGSLGMSNVLSTDKKQQVIALGKLGWSLRRIEEATGVRRETASAYLKAAGVAVCLPGWGPRAPAKPAILTPDFFAPFSQKPDAPSACVPQKLHQAIFIQCNVTGGRKNNSPGTGFDASHPTDAKDRAGRPPPVAARRGRPRRAWAWPRCSDAPSCSLIKFLPSSGMLAVLKSVSGARSRSGKRFRQPVGNCSAIA